MREVIAPRILKNPKSRMDALMAQGLIDEPSSDFPMFSDLFQTICSCLERLPLFLAQSQNKPFICPDDHVLINFGQNPDPNIPSEKTVLTGMHATMPISSKYLIQFGPPEKLYQDHAIQVDPEAVSQWNKNAALEAVAIYGENEKTVLDATEDWA